MTVQAPSQLQRDGLQKFSTGKFVAYVVLFTFLGYFLLPLIWLVISSTKTNAGLFSSFGFWFDKDFNFFQNLKALFARDNGAFGVWMQNTAIYAISASLISSFVSAMAGYAFSQYRFAGRKLLFGIVLGSVFVPGTVFAVPLYLLLVCTLFLLQNKAGLQLPLPRCNLSRFQASIFTIGNYFLTIFS